MYVVCAQVSINGRQDGWALAAWLVEEFASGRWTSLQTRCARGQPTRWCTVMQDRVLGRSRVHCAATWTRCACAHRVPYDIPWQMSYGKVAFVTDEVRSCQENHRVFVGKWCGEQPSIRDATRNAERASGCVRAVPDGTPYSALRLLPKRCAVASSANPPPSFLCRCMWTRFRIAASMQGDVGSWCRYLAVSSHYSP